EKNLIAGFDVPVAPGARNEIYGLSRAARKNDFLGAAGIEKTRYALPRRLECRSRAIAQFMNASMHVGIVQLVKIPQRINNRVRFLAGGRIVEINQRMTVDGLMQCRKIITEF